MPGVGGARLTTAGRIRDESSVHALKIKEVDTRIESEIAGVRTSIQSAKFNVLQVRPQRQRAVPLTAVPCGRGYRCRCAPAGLPAYVPLRRGVARTSPAVCVARVDVFVQRVVKAERSSRTSGKRSPPRVPWLSRVCCRFPWPSARGPRSCAASSLAATPTVLATSGCCARRHRLRHVIVLSRRGSHGAPPRNLALLAHHGYADHVAQPVPHQWAGPHDAGADADAHVHPVVRRAGRRRRA